MGATKVKEAQMREWRGRKRWEGKGEGRAEWKNKGEKGEQKEGRERVSQARKVEGQGHDHKRHSKGASGKENRKSMTE